ncbi:MAG: hypothetical protein Q8L88_10750 [Bacteroidota bacterium]|nr:hypothetical protein [Bacteroidota bacterium]
MNGKFFAALFFCVVNVLFSGEKTFTGNFRVDLLNSVQDSVSETEMTLTKNDLRQNPFMNGLYSLVLPGAGEFHTERYTKAAIFFSAEVALIVYAVISNNNGDKKTNEFQAYAEAHWDAERYARWIQVHGKSEYGPTNVEFNDIDFAAIKSKKDFSKINEWESGLHKLGFSHQLPAYQAQQYYELIGKYHQFKFGWDTYPDLNNDGVPDSDGGDYDNLLTSEKQFKDYAVERGKANDYYYAASFAASALVINHVLSAVDAFFSTNSYNKELTASFHITPVNGLEGKRLLSEVRVQIPF